MIIDACTLNSTFDLDNLSQRKQEAAEKSIRNNKFGSSDSSVRLDKVISLSSENNDRRW